MTVNDVYDEAADLVSNKWGNADVALELEDGTLLRSFRILRGRDYSQDGELLVVFTAKHYVESKDL